VGHRGWLGAELMAAPGEAGVRVRRIVRGSPAARAGIVAGDLIVRVDGQTVQEPAELVRRVADRPAGHRASIALRRGDVDRLLGVVLAPRPDDDGMLKLSHVGAPAPAFESLQTVQGSVTPSLAALRGKVVVLEFWASWCAVCRILVPTINDWHARFSAQGVEVLGVTTDPVGLASRSAYELRMSYPVLSDHTGKTTEAYGAMALPTLFVLDRKGVVRDVMVGYSSGRLAELEQLIERLVAEN
jgi:peroxiredoxin